VTLYTYDAPVYRYDAVITMLHKFTAVLALAGE
jgi:hypothetical protein